jgi:prepilin-type N-terminal cleavage/methylation domain-containing protein
MPTDDAKELEPRSTRAFTLIELLVVISIISVLAGLTVGLSSLAGRKSKEARVKAEMNKLINAIENYKSAMGFYPPDAPGLPSTNQLFYELSGTVFTNNLFVIPGSQDALLAAAPQGVFNAAGIANSARDQRDLKFTEDFKKSQFDRVTVIDRTSGNSIPANILVVPVKGPLARMQKSTSGALVNPWMYVSASPTNNPGRFDLWTEVIIGKYVVRISNWEKDPVPVQ